MLTLNRLFHKNKTILTSVNGPMVHNILNAFGMLHEALEIKLCLPLLMRSSQLAMKR